MDGGIERLALDQAQEFNRVVVAIEPELGVYQLENLLRVGLPRPPQVERELNQPVNAPRQDDAGEQI